MVAGNVQGSYLFQKCGNVIRNHSSLANIKTRGVVCGRGSFRGVSEVSRNHSGFSLDDGCAPFRLHRFTVHGGLRFFFLHT